MGGKGVAAGTGWMRLVQIGMVCVVAACGGSGGNSDDTPDQVEDPAPEASESSTLWLASASHIWRLSSEDATEIEETDHEGATVGAISELANGLYRGHGAGLTAALFDSDLNATSLWEVTPGAHRLEQLMPVPEAGLWALTGANELVAIDHDGRTVATHEPATSVIDLALAPPGAEDGIAGYSLHANTLSARGPFASQVDTFDLAGLGSSTTSPQALVAGHDDRLWLLAGDVLHATSASGDSIRTLSLTDARYDRLQADGRGGAWLIGDHHLKHVDAEGATRAQHDLIASGHMGPVVAATADPADGGLWFVAGTTLIHAGPNGDVDSRRDLNELVGTETITGLWLYADTHAPELAFAEPDGTAWTNEPAPEIVLDWSDAGLGIEDEAFDIRIVDGMAVDDAACSSTQGAALGEPREGRLRCPLPALGDGDHSLIADARDRAGNPAESDKARLVIDTRAPEISLDPDPDGSWTNAAEVRLQGRLSESADLVIADTAVATDVDHGFSHAVQTNEDGTYVIRLNATDRAGNTTTRSVTIHRDTAPPEAVDLDLLNVTIDDAAIEIDSEPGAVEPHARVQIRNTRTGETVSVIADADGAFFVEITGATGDPVEITVQDRAGNQSDATETIAGEVPNDPAHLAPPLEASGQTPMHDAVSFLYSGDNPLQQGVESGAIEPERVAVVRGRVRARDGAPLADVQVRILDHPELGHTKTRADGRFDIAVNGGGAITVIYDKDGYLPAQRQTQTGWEDWSHVDDVVLIRPDERVTEIDLTDTSKPFQVARGSQVSDDDGQRQATLLFPAGTQATYTNADGETETLEQIDVRATEYTVGDNGLATMPAPLPPATAYTYAVELSIDQILELGRLSDGRDVRFSKSVPFYVDNFLDFPAGEPVPTGFLNQTAGRWEAHDDGRVIDILAIDDGRAMLDVTGDGEANSGEALDALGITEAERARLAELYEAGDSLWRVSLDHFSTWDCNWPYGPPEDAESPSVPDPQPPQDQDSGEEDECEGCVISPQRGSVGESIDIAGTPYALHYRSDRAEGYERTAIEIPLTDADLPASLERIDLTIDIAGRRFTRSFDPDPNQSHHFAWDGYDAYGNRRRGAERAVIRLSYVYGCRYLGGTPGGSGRAFGRFGNMADPIGGLRSRCQGFAFTRTSEIAIASPHAPKVLAGNWSLSVEHRLAAEAGVLNKGEGSQRHLPPRVIEAVAGTGERGTVGDGGPATEARLFKPRDVAIAPDGTMYIADRMKGVGAIRKVAPDGTISTLSTGHRPIAITLGPDGTVYFGGTTNRLLRVDADGRIETVAGTGESGFSGDGGPATEAQIHSAWGIAVDDDGTIYFSDASNNRIRRVSPDGIIDTVAGTGESGFSGDGGPASEAKLRSPVGLALGHDGELYVADRSNARIRRIGRDGTIDTIAGIGLHGYDGDGGPADEARLSSPWGVTVSPDGSLFVFDTSNDRIRRIAPDGIIHTYVGTGVGGDGDDGGPATSTRIHRPYNGDVTADGKLIFADNGNRRVRGIEAGGIRETASGAFMVASRDGARQYVFDSAGRHLRTESSHTSEVLLAFKRDGEGRVVAVTNGDDNTTSITRDSEGRAVAVVAPDGQLTRLTVDAADHLVAVENPVGSQWSMTYSEEGLLTDYDHPLAGAYTFDYDGHGRLVRDTDPQGGGWSLVRTDIEDGYRTDMTTAEGRLHRFAVERPGDGRRIYSRTLPDDTVSRRVHSADEVRIDRRDGTEVAITRHPDPRYGMNAAYVGEHELETPSGLSRRVSVERSAEVGDPADPLSLEALTEVRKIGERAHTTTYAAAARTWETESPAGRATTTVIDGQGRPIEQRIAGLAAVHADYDDRGRPATATMGSGDEARTIAFSYHQNGPGAGYLASITDALGRETGFVTDAAGRVTEQTTPEGRSIGYQYDGYGNLTAITPPGRSAHLFEYDGLDQRTTYEPPELDGIETVTRYRYNLDRQLTEIERPDGATVTFDYDAGGRLAARSSDAGTVTHGYDTATGRLVSLEAPGDIGQRFEYDGFLKTAEEWSGAVTGRIDWSYDNNFWLTEEAVGGHSTSFDYDDDGLLTQAGTLDIERDPDHGLITGTTQALIDGSRGYNAFGELDEHTVSTSDSDLYRVDYSRDALGRITEQTETIDGDSRALTYEYDPAGRLIEVRRNGTPAHLYSYDANGNRTNHTGPQGTRTGEYDEQDRLIEYGGHAYSYTEAGELREKTGPAGTTTYAYDAMGNLRAVDLSDGRTIDYLIDGQDRRVGKKVNGELEQGWLYRDQLNPVAQTDAEGNFTHRFIYAEQGHSPSYMVRMDADTGEQTPYRMITDHVGSIRLVVNAQTGEIAQRIDYDPFGQVTTDTNPGFQPFGFAGGLYDRDTGLVRFGARDYDPHTGRWAAKDPILFRGGDTNLYGYVLANPVNMIDPAGLFGSIVEASNPQDQSQVAQAEREAGREMTMTVRQVGRAACFESCALSLAVGTAVSESLLHEAGRRAEVAGGVCKAVAKRVIPVANVISTVHSTAGLGSCIRKCYQ